MDTTTLRSKIATMPAPLREWYASEKIVDVITTINEHFKISQVNPSVVSKLLLRLAIKDLDAEYFSGELASQLNIDKNNALAITAEVKKAVLSPLRKELSDYGINIDLLDKFQMPIIKLQTPTSSTPVPTPAGPKIISEAFTARPVVMIPAVPMAQPAPKPQAPIAAPAPTPAPAPMPMKPAMSPAPQPKPIIPAPVPAKPPVVNTSNAGWSRQTSQNPVVKLGVITPNVPTSTPRPTGGSAPTNIAAKPATSPISPKGMSEFERMDIMKRGIAPGMNATPQANAPAQKPAAVATVPPPPPAPPQIPQSSKPPEPPPVMLHQASIPRTLQNAPNFQIDRKAQNQMSGATAPKAVLKPAVLELGGVPASGAGASAPSGAASSGGAPKVVHYSEYKTTISAPSGAVPSTAAIASGSSAPSSAASAAPARQITEITAAAQKPVTVPPPQPASPPKPPTSPAPTPASTPSTPKVIVQDFLGPKR